MKKIYLTLPFLLFPLVTLAHAGDDFTGHHMGMGMSMGNFGFFGGGILTLSFWILLIVGIIYLIKHSSRSGEHREKGGGRAIEILKERYAKDEITKEEFEQKKKELR